MKDVNEDPQGGGEAEPEITLVAVAKQTYYVVEGEEHIQQMLLVDGVFPMPVLCIHFNTVADIREAMGQSVDMSAYWTIHPEIIKRLRETNVLVEKVV